MVLKLRNLLLRVALVCTVAAGCIPLGCSGFRPGMAPDGQITDEEPSEESQLRAIWVGTAFNLDWPSRPGLSPSAMHDEIRTIVARACELNCNAIILQVRAFSDRIYRKTNFSDPNDPQPLYKKEPWAECLSDRSDPQGGWPPFPLPPPNPADYDPLEAWITECHDQGLEIYAWMNPFRTNHLVKGSDGKPLPMRLSSPDGDELYLDATWDSVQQYVLAVLDDFIAHYMTTSVDGLMFDHDMPPYDMRIQSAALKQAPATQARALVKPKVYPSPRMSRANRQARNKWLYGRNKGDDATNNPNPNPKTINEFIQKVFWKVHGDVTHQGAGLKFGFSPSTSESQSTSNTRAKQWLRDGLLNFVVPEFYSNMTGDDLTTAIESWQQVAKEQRQNHPGFESIVVPALYPQGLRERRSGKITNGKDLEEQLQAAQQAEKPPVRFVGEAFYSYSSLRDPLHGGPADPETPSIPKKGLGYFQNQLQERWHANASLVPPCTKPSATVPEKPIVTDIGGGYVEIKLDHGLGNTRWWAIWTFKSGEGSNNPRKSRWKLQRVPARSDSYPYNFDVSKYDAIKVKAINKFNQRSDDFGEWHR